MLLPVLLLRLVLVLDFQGVGTLDDSRRLLNRNLPALSVLAFEKMVQRGGVVTGKAA